MDRPTLQTVADRARVSPATVSLVLSGRARSYRIAERTCRRVSAVAAELGYAPNEQARRLKGLGVTTVGLVVPGLDNPHFARLAAAAEAAASARGWHLWIVDSREDATREREQISSLLQRGVDALVVAAVDPDLRVSGVPAIGIDRVPGQGWRTVTSDDRRSSRRLAAAMFAAGHFGPGTWFVGGDPGITTARERRRGFEAAARAAGLRSGDWRLVEAGFSPAVGARVAGEALAAGARGMFVASYTLLEGVLTQLRDLPRDRMPELACFDDHPLLDLLRVPVSSVAPDHAAIVAAALDGLASWLDHHHPPREQITVPATLRWRHPGRPPAAAAL